MNAGLTTGMQTLVLQWIFKIITWPADARAFSRPSLFRKGKVLGTRLTLRHVFTPPPDLSFEDSAHSYDQRNCFSVYYYSNLDRITSSWSHFGLGLWVQERKTFHSFNGLLFFKFLGSIVRKTMVKKNRRASRLPKREIQKSLKWKWLTRFVTKRVCQEQ